MRLSVIIPGYNTPVAWWQRCVRSVLAALGPDDEVICVDDGSNTPVADSWQEISCGDVRARLLPLEKNLGQASARNAALDIAHGEFVTFVDSDDEVLSETYKRCFEVQEEFDCDIVVYGVKVIWVADKLYKEDCLPRMNLSELNGNSLAKLVRSCLFDYTCNKVYRRSFLDVNGVRFEQDANPGEDVVLNLKCVLSNATWGVSDYIGYVYYRYDGSSLSRYAPNIKMSLNRRSEMWRLCKEKCIGAREFLGGYGETSDNAVEIRQWQNLWRKGSPFSLPQRWRYIVAHPNVAKMSLPLEYIYTCFYSFLRGHFYFSWIRKPHIRLMYPQVKDLSNDL